MNDLVAWLRSRLDMDERIAQAAIAESDDAEWTSVSTGVVGAGGDDLDGLITTSRNRALHIVRCDPRSALDRVEAERMILDRWDEVSTWTYSPARKELAGAIRLLAYGHRRQPGYRPEWAPEGVTVVRCGGGGT